ncbi:MULTISPECIES: VOC family protein [Rhizobium]|uniref:Catechol 2,3-dioxygenase-like lactoylglutathione lyase family enzyme n=1 Tax=Rhizobium paranaense TaxID=1650438 RepID=A0A7W8XP84_9HYPH|nr:MULTISPECIES: VOC family protein [Rhizobium]MBB5573055.1 catechol 2,3-dioxygenase-like lactoylglutathione lyase family enzyme [Rhizobium paranaense]PST62099.1 glyoxalase [Rhizobium sp. SEMIA4064]
MPIGRLVLYARDMEATIGFYEKHFGFRPLRQDGDRIVELLAPDGGANLMIHPAAKTQKMGQSLVKLVFDVEHVEAFRTKCASDGLEFGPVHQADGYVFANAKDPCGNSISISSRAFRR